MRVRFLCTPLPKYNVYCRELNFRVTSIVEQHFKQIGILFKSSNVGFGRQPTLLLKDFFNRSTEQAGNRGLHLWAQQALKDAKAFKAIGLARDTLLGKHELVVQQVASMHI
jgi:hypothetical protein